MIGYPSGQDGPILPSWDFPCWGKNCLFCHKMNTLLAQPEAMWIAEYWPSSFLHFNVFDFDFDFKFDFVLVHKKKRERTLANIKPHLDLSLG